MSTFLLNKKYLPHRVGVCFIIGIIAGLFFHDFSIWVKPAGDLFMNMIKMLIVPVTYSSFSAFASTLALYSSICAFTVS